MSFRLPFVLFDSFLYNPRKFGASKNQKNRTLPFFLCTPYTQQLMEFVRFCHPEVNDVIKNDRVDKVYKYYGQVENAEVLKRKYVRRKATYQCPVPYCVCRGLVAKG